MTVESTLRFSALLCAYDQSTNDDFVEQKNKVYPAIAEAFTGIKIDLLTSNPLILHIEIQ